MEEEYLHILTLLSMERRAYGMFEYGSPRKMKAFAYDADYLLAQYCMPTICKRKPSNLIQINKRMIRDSDTEFYQSLEREVIQFECNSSILYENDNIATILIYNMPFIDMLLQNDNVRAFLQLYGYNEESLKGNECLMQLKERYQHYWLKGEAFPHEIGILLGYPLADVEGFIKNNGQNYLLNGFWKVYQNREKAEETFLMYRSLREYAIKFLIDGKRLDEIIPHVYFRNFL